MPLPCSGSLHIATASRHHHTSAAGTFVTCGLCQIQSTNHSGTRPRSATLKAKAKD